ncbi:MAG: hypothetical protein JWN86_4341 [Planctomycetota bacterium]|nr:hypothetical protein [Planctomycetota bacterium]
MIEPSGMIYAVAVDGTRPIVRSDVVRIHRFSRGWSWVTSAPENYPAPPFLLTRDLGFRLIYSGPVTLLPNDEMAEELMADELGAYEAFDMPVVADGWFGWLKVLAEEHARPQLVAFAKGKVHLTGRVDGLIWPEEDEPFGSIILPPTKGPFGKGVGDQF